MIRNHGIFFIGVFTLLLLFSNVTYGNNTNAFAQNSTSPSIPSTISSNTTSNTAKSSGGNGGIKITSPEKGSIVPTNSNSSFIIRGISKDNATSNCKVAIIINGIKPYQPVQPMNAAGKEDYSAWQYTLSKNYTQIIVGSNKITAKSYCLSNPQSSYYSTNITGMNFTPEQLKNYNSPIQQPKATVSNISSSSLAIQHPIAQQIQQIKDTSQSNPPPCCITVSNSTSQAVKSINPLVPLVAGATPSVADATGHAIKHVKHTTIHPIKHVKHVKVVKHVKPVKVVKHMKMKMKKNNNNNNQSNKHNGNSNDLQNRIINQVRNNLASAGINTN
ncbi:MAG: hypothetical protein M3Z01_03595 [Thermoproteota archaeon]|nr:hypothetical protein [Thermoproteota archaeon]